VRNKITSKLRKVVKSPAFSLLLASVLLICGLLEAFEIVIEHVDIAFKAHHGLIVFGVGHILASLVDILEGTEGVVISEVAEDIEQEVEQMEVH